MIVKNSLVSLEDSERERAMECRLQLKRLLECESATGRINLSSGDKRSVEKVREIVADLLNGEPVKERDFDEAWGRMELIMGLLSVRFGKKE